MPIFYECQRCTACCRWLGEVRVSDVEIARLAAFKGMSEHDFIQQFTKLHRDRRGLALQEKSDGSCVFLEDNDCSVQSVKPQQCRDFPNLWNFPGFEKICQAVPPTGEPRGVPASGGRRHRPIGGCGRPSAAARPMKPPAARGWPGESIDCVKACGALVSGYTDKISGLEHALLNLMKLRSVFPVATGLPAKTKGLQIPNRFE